MAPSTEKVDRKLLDAEYDSLFAKMASNGGETGRQLLAELAARSPAKMPRSHGSAGTKGPAETIQGCVPSSNGKRSPPAAATLPARRRARIKSRHIPVKPSLARSKGGRSKASEQGGGTGARDDGPLTIAHLPPRMSASSLDSDDSSVSNVASDSSAAQRPETHAVCVHTRERSATPSTPRDGDESNDDQGEVSDDMTSRADDDVVVRHVVVRERRCIVPSVSTCAVEVLSGRIDPKEVDKAVYQENDEEDLGEQDSEDEEDSEDEDDSEDGEDGEDEETASDGIEYEENIVVSARVKGKRKASESKAGSRHQQTGTGDRISGSVQVDEGAQVNPSTKPRTKKDPRMEGAWQRKEGAHTKRVRTKGVRRPSEGTHSKSLSVVSGPLASSSSAMSASSSSSSLAPRQMSIRDQNIAGKKKKQNAYDVMESGKGRGGGGG